jgi:dynein heavy chain, axonemal
MTRHLQVTHAIFPQEDVQLNARVFLWPRDIEAVFNISRGRLAHRREAVEAALRERKTAFEASLVQQQQQLNELQRKDPAILTGDDIRDALALVQSLASALKASKEQAQVHTSYVCMLERLKTRHSRQLTRKNLS